MEFDAKEMEFDNSSSLVKMQQCQLQMLKELLRVCREKDISFYLAYGTCLGAVRHNGFIPWDDDIDVYMHITDLEKLKKNRDIFQKKYQLQTHDLEKEYGLQIARLRDSETTLIEADLQDRDINQGVYIDIYPLYNCEKSKLQIRKMVACSYLYRLFIYHAPPVNRGKAIIIGSKVLLHITPQKMKDWCVAKTYSYFSTRKDDGFYTPLYGHNPYSKLPKEWFIKAKNVKFEGMDVPAPSDTDAYLKYMYGEYMKLPPEDQRKIHHKYIFIDFDKSYLAYKGVKYCIKR